MYNSIKEMYNIASLRNYFALRVPECLVKSVDYSVDHL